MLLHLYVALITSVAALTWELYILSGVEVEFTYLWIQKVQVASSRGSSEWPREASRSHFIGNKFWFDQKCLPEDSTDYGGPVE